MSPEHDKDARPVEVPGEVRGEANDELGLMNAHTHVAFEKECNAAEHLLLNEAFAPTKRAANSFR